MAEFENPELLDQDNMWYCPSCKTHVQATKSLKLYKAPLVLVINLKRFKQGKNRYGFSSMGYGGGGGGKLDTLVDFPINGFDLKPFLQHDDGQEYIYDLFGISNHYGGLGGGHYTAYAKNWKDNAWYSFDDSSCSKSSESRIITSAAYNLFYRRRGVVNLEDIPYNKLRQTATMESLEQFKRSDG